MLQEDSQAQLYIGRENPGSVSRECDGNSLLQPDEKWLSEAYPSESVHVCAQQQELLRILAGDPWSALV